MFSIHTDLVGVCNLL